MKPSSAISCPIKIRWGIVSPKAVASKVKPDIEIVGVVKDAKYADMREAPPRALYLPYRQKKRQDALYFYLRTAIEPQQIAAQIRREVAALDSNLPIRDLKTMQAQIEENLFAERLLSSLTGSFAGLATLLAAIGLYGVLAYNVSRRTREIGIRMALGAEAGHVRGLVIREVAFMLAIGTAIGLGSAAGAGTLIRSQLYGLEYWDPTIYVSAAAVRTNRHLPFRSIAAGTDCARDADLRRRLWIGAQSWSICSGKVTKSLAWTRTRGPLTRCAAWLRSLEPDLPADNFRVETVEATSFGDAFADVAISSAVLHFARDDAAF
jgi:hypothetical protein